MAIKSSRISAFEARFGYRLLGKLGPGPGQDGFVMRSSRFTAVKFFDQQFRFDRELEVYRVLQSTDIVSTAGHNVPAYLADDIELRTIEMSIVERPFILDFAGAKLPHEVPDFEAHTIEEHLKHLREIFGEQWADALHVAEMFRRTTGYVLLDIHPGNIAFPD